MFWPQWIMHQIGYFPPRCELDAITAAATRACDELDGLKDGIIGLPGQCAFNPHTIVGQQYACGNATGTITKEAAEIARATWEGATNAQGKLQFPGLAPGSPLSGIAGTTCDASGNCTGAPFTITTDWHRLFIQKSPSFDPYSYTHAHWDAALHASTQQYTSSIGTSDADLSLFKRSGGKMLTWHGMADQLIPFNSTLQYYTRVLGLDPKAADFYRFFAAPGVAHCSGGPGAQPTDPLAQLVSWVEAGEAPGTLGAERTVDGVRWERELCLFPLSSIYKGGDPAVAASYSCE
jgi:hypothetical protein